MSLETIDDTQTIQGCYFTAQLANNLQNKGGNNKETLLKRYIQKYKNKKEHC